MYIHDFRYIFCLFVFIYLILISIIGSSSKSFLVTKNLNTNTAAAASAKLVTVDRRNISQLTYLTCYIKQQIILIFSQNWTKYIKELVFIYLQDKVFLPIYQLAVNVSCEVMRNEKNYLEDNMKDIEFHIIAMFSNLFE